VLRGSVSRASRSIDRSVRNDSSTSVRPEFVHAREVVKKIVRLALPASEEDNRVGEPLAIAA
jgi:hypothetical protein